MVDSCVANIIEDVIPARTVVVRRFVFTIASVCNAKIVEELLFAFT